MDLRDRDHEVVQRIVVARHDRRHRLRHGDGGRDRIGGLVRHRAMAADAGDVDLERVDRGHDRPRRRQDLPQFQPRHVVDGIHAPDAEAVHDALFAHHPCPAAIFLGGLEDQRDLAREIPRLGQVFRRPQQHRRMPVMAAGMHLARGGGGMRGPRRLHDRQRIHIGAKPDDRPLSLPFDDRHDPACRDPLVKLVDPELPEPRGHEARRLVAVEGQFGMRVQMTAPALHLFGIGGNAVDHWHRLYSRPRVGSKERDPAPIPGHLQWTTPPPIRDPAPRLRPICPPWTACARSWRGLRDPEHGCPWDVEQTFATIAPYTIEEAYEVADAIAREAIWTS
jgi:hypothetical protein